MKNKLGAFFLGAILVATVGGQADVYAAADTGDVAVEDTVLNGVATGLETAQPETPKFVYNPVGRRDPFRSLLEIRKPVAERREPQTPLEQFDLSQIRMVGAIVGFERPRAMVSAPDGKSYIVTIGTRMGKNNGKVVSIDQYSIVVEESFYDFADEVRTSRQAIELPKREGV